jgi:hypothetical protein
MRSVAIAIALTLIATVASAKGGGGGAGGAGARAAVSATTGAGAVVVPGTLTQPGIVTAPGVATPQGTVVGNTIVVPPAIVVPGLAPSAVVTTPGATASAVVQPLMITPPSAGTQLGAGIGNQAGGFNSQPATQTVPPGTTPPFTSPLTSGTVASSAVATPGLAGVVVAPFPIGIPIVGLAAPGTLSGAPAAPPPSPLVIAAPSTSVTADSAARARTLPSDAAGVVVEQMMIAEVVGVDRDAGCITARGPNGDRASYRMTMRAADSATVNRGDRIVVEVQRPLVALSDADGAPSASPRLSDRDSAAQTGRSSAGSTNIVNAGAKRTADTGRRTVIWSMGNPAMVISDHAVACGS